MKQFDNSIDENPGKTAAILSYFSPLGWLFAYIVLYKNDKTELASFHIRQTLLFFITIVAFSLIFSFLLAIIMILSGIDELGYLYYLMFLGFFIIWLIGLRAALNAKMNPLPIIGKMAQRVFSDL